MDKTDTEVISHNSGIQKQSEQQTVAKINKQK